MKDSRQTNCFDNKDLIYIEAFVSTLTSLPVVMISPRPNPYSRRRTKYFGCIFNIQGNEQRGRDFADIKCVFPWWYHQTETFSALLALLQGIHRWPYIGQWRRALMFSLIYAWTNGWINNPYAGDLRRHRAHCDVIVMINEKFFVAILMGLFSEPYWHQVFTTSGYQAVTWTNGDTVCLHIYA